MTQPTSTASGAEDFTDVQYLEQMADHYASSPVPEIRAHQKRLRAIAAALASAALVEQPDSLISCVIGDSNYAAGMLLGWNLCAAGNEEAFRRIREDRLRAASQASNASRGQAPTCQHRIVDARNPIIKSGYVCLNCGALFAAGDHDAAQAPAQAADSVGRDTARLDWLEKCGSVEIERCKYLGSDDTVIEVTPYNSDSYEGDTLRAAIDAARKQGANHD